MIKIVAEEKLKVITTYDNNNEIIKSFETYSFLPLELLEVSKNKENFVQYLIKIKKTLTYLVQLFHLIQFVKQTELNIDEYQNHETYQIEGTNIVLSDIEKDLYIEMIYGKKLFARCQQLLQCNLLSNEIREWIIEKENRINNLTETNEKHLKYFCTNRDELDIYRFMCKDLFHMFRNDFAKYFTTSKFFSNTGFSYFTLDEDIYSYFVGNFKGYIPTIDKYTNYRVRYVEEYYNRLFQDFQELSDQISETLGLSTIYQISPCNNDTPNPIIKKFFDTHNISQNVFDYLENKGMIKKNTNGLFTLVNNYQTQVITLFCYRCKSPNPEYDLYSDLFENFIRNRKEEYKKNRIKDSEYMANTIKPLFNNISREG